MAVDNEVNYKEQYLKLSKKVSELEAKLRLFTQPGAMRGYYALNRLLNLQVDIIETLDLEGEVKKNPKEDKFYDRVKDMWKELPAFIKEIEALAPTVGATEDEERDVSRKASFLDKMIRG